MKQLLQIIVLLFLFNPRSDVHASQGQSIVDGLVEAKDMAGLDIGAQINAAYNVLPPTGGRIHIASNGSCYDFTTPIILNTNQKIATLDGDTSGTCLHFISAAGVAITIDWGAGHIPGSTQNIKLMGPGPGTSTVGIKIGSLSYVDQAYLENIYVSGFGTGLLMAGQTFNTTITKSVFIKNRTGILLNSSELVRLTSSLIAQNDTGISLGEGFNNELYIGADSFDDNSNVAISGVGFVTGEGNHFENVGQGTSQYITMTGGYLSLRGGQFLDDVANGTQAQMITIAGHGQVFFYLDHPFVYSKGRKITNSFGGGGEVSIANDNVAAILSSFTISGPGQFRVYDLSQSGTSAASVVFNVGSFMVQDSNETNNPRYVLRSNDANTSDRVLDLTGTANSAVTRIYKQSKGTDTTLALGSWDSVGNFTPGAHLNQATPDRFAGTCVMSASTTCSIRIGSAYTVSPICVVTVQSADVIAGGCTVTGTTVTITAASLNSNTWAALLIGNPN